jgi:esterase/lipase
VASTPTDSDRIPLILIHGAWLSSRSWENFAGYFEKRDFAVSAPEWPRTHGDVPLVGAERDNTVPASLARKQYEKYQRSSARTDYVEFEGRPHLLMAAEGWDEVAASIDRWPDGVLDAPLPPAQRVSA